MAAVCIALAAEGTRGESTPDRATGRGGTSVQPVARPKWLQAHWPRPLSTSYRGSSKRPAKMCPNHGGVRRHGPNLCGGDFSGTCPHTEHVSGTCGCVSTPSVVAPSKPSPATPIRPSKRNMSRHPNPHLGKAGHHTAHCPISPAATWV